MRWEQAKCMEKKIERKRNRAGEETKGGGSKERMGGGRDLEKGERRGRWKRSRQLGWETGLNWKGGIRE